MKHRKSTKSAATLLSLVAMASTQASYIAIAQVSTPQAPSASTGQTATPSKTTSASSATTTKSKSTKTVVKRSVAPVPPKPPKPVWQEFKLDPKSTMQLDFTDANPDSIISMFAHASGITIVKDPSLKATLTVQSAKPVHLDEAFSILNTVLKLNGYELQKEDNLLVVGKKAAAAPPPPPPGPMPTPQPAPGPSADEPVVRFYPLKYANASEVAKVVNEVFTQQALESMIQSLQQGGGMQGGPQQMQGRPQPQKIVRASSEDYSNTVIVNAPEKNQKDVDLLIKQIDISTEAPLDSEIFQFKYVTVDEVVDAIKEVLTSNTPTGKGSAKPGNNDNNNFYYYNPFRQQSSTSAGGQSVVAIKQTNSIIVTATKENMELVRKLISNLDTEGNYVGTTSVIHLENAKATDVATLLNNAFTKRRDQNSDNPFFFIYSDNPSQGSKTDVTTDLDEHGKVVNVRDLTGKVNIVADANTNSLIVVTLPSNLKLIKKVVDAIDVVSAQVMIETIIVEASLDKTTKLGVEWNFAQNSVLGSGSTTAAGTQDFGIQSASPLPQGFRYTLSGKDYQAFLNALETNNRYKILDTPRVFTSNNVQAKIDVSQQYPYTQNQSTTLGSGLFGTTSFLPIGVVLTVTPRITAAGEVAMDVDQTADDLQGLSTAGAPIVNHREAKSTVTIHDGETILLGGIISHNTTINESKIPILGDIPLLGKLFQSSSHENTQTELMVFMTPHIVVAPPDAVKIREVSEKEMSKTSHDSVDATIKQSQIKN